MNLKTSWTLASSPCSHAMSRKRYSLPLDLTTHSKHSFPPAFLRQVSCCSVICFAVRSTFFDASRPSVQRSVLSLNSRTPGSQRLLSRTTPLLRRASPSHLPLVAGVGVAVAVRVGVGVGVGTKAG